MTATFAQICEPGLDGFGALYRDVHPRVLSAVRRLPRREDPEEIVQEAFARVWERWDRIGGMDDPEGYVFRVALNIWKRAGCRHETLDLVPEAAPQRDAVGAVDIQVSLEPVLRRLSRRQRTLVTLVGVYGFEPTEAAAALGIAPATARVHLTRARRALRTELTQAG